MGERDTSADDAMRAAGVRITAGYTVELGRERDEAIDRAERAEAGLAALRERCRSHMTSAELADTAAAAEAYRARVRAEALREAAGTFDRFVAENQVLGRIDVADAWMFDE